jgi:hypothetical protein
MTITAPSSAFAAYDRAMTTDIEEITLEDWTPAVRPEPTDKAIEDWIAEFARTGDIEDELGAFKSHYGTVVHRLAEQWVRDKSKITDAVGEALWKWAKACAYLAGY